MASHNQAVEQTAWDALNANPGKPLLAAAYRQRFFPGSTFKVITAAAVYDHRPALANRYYPVTAGFVLPDTADQVLHNFAGETCGGEMLALFTVSCDTGFAQLGLGVGAAGLVDEANAFGWDQTPPLDLPGVAQSSFPPVSSFHDNLAALAKSAIGQESVQATPLTLAMDVGGVANGGVIMTPHLLDTVPAPRPDRPVLQAQALADRYLPGDGRQAHQADAFGCEQPERHRGSCSDPGDPGRRQDRDSTDRTGLHRNLVRLFRPCP